MVEHVYNKLDEIEGEVSLRIDDVLEIKENVKENKIEKRKIKVGEVNL